MGILIDSSVFIAIERRGLPPNDGLALIEGEVVGIAAITASELLAGIHHAGTTEHRLRREAFVEALLELVPILPFDLLVARTYARLWSHLAAAGEPIGAHDLLIAATAVTHNYGVLTLNVRDFQRVPGVNVHQPTF